MQHLVKRATVEDIVAAYRAACETVTRCFTELAEAQRSYADAVLSKHRGFFAFQARHGRGTDFTSDIPLVLANIHRDTWTVIFEKLEVVRFLSSERMKELERQIEDGEMPEITVEAVMSAYTSLCVQLPELSKESVKEAYNILRPRGHTRVGKLKTNTELEVGRKVILSSMVGPSWGGKLRVSTYGEEQLRTLERVMRMLDGKGTFTEQYHSAIWAEMDAGNASGETEFFKFKGCKNGNMHLEFKRLDLLAKLNEIAGGKNLRPHQEEKKAS